MCGRTRVRKTIVTPGQKVTVITSSGEKTMTWGFDSGQWYNARCETIEQKSYWSEHLNNRCVVQVDSFFEKKGEFALTAETDKLFLAGIYNDKEEFAIITVPSDSTVVTSHHRMPLIIDEPGLYAYLGGRTELFMFYNSPAYLLKKVA